MQAGEVWVVNNTSDHAVINRNPHQERTHIIMDKDPVPELMDMITNTPPAEGWQDRDAIAELMKDSRSPAISPYAAGKPVPV